MVPVIPCVTRVKHSLRSVYLFLCGFVEALCCFRGVG